MTHPSPSRDKMLKSLDEQLGDVCVVTTKKSITIRTKHMSESVCDEDAVDDEAVHKHLTGQAPSMSEESDDEQQRRAVQEESRRQMELPLASPSWPDAMETKTPMSPSVATTAFDHYCRQQNDARLRLAPTSRGPKQQICFGMDESLMSASGVAENRNYDRQTDDSSGVSSTAASDVGHTNNSSRPTHRVQHTFIPRHSDEVQLDMGDPVHVFSTNDDRWCHGCNLRTGLSGIFPDAHVFEVDLCDEMGLGSDERRGLGKLERDTFALKYLGSLEVAHHKGNEVLVQAINKVLAMYARPDDSLVPKHVILEINFQGIHMIQKSRGTSIFRCPQFDYFYSLQNISFCGAHPKQFRYFGFISKHPLLPRFGCHVFLSCESTQPVVESIGRAFKRSYDEYMAFAHPTEDIFID